MNKWYSFLLFSFVCHSAWAPEEPQVPAQNPETPQVARHSRENSEIMDIETPAVSRPKRDTGYNFSGKAKHVIRALIHFGDNNN